MTDEELVHLVLLGRIQAYDVLVKRFRHAVILVAEQTVQSHDVAEDVAQEVFLVALKSLPRLRDPKRFASWLYAIARYRARRVRKQERNMEPLEAERLDTVPNSLLTKDTGNPEKALLNGQLQNEIACAVANLKPEIALVFRLRYEEAWPVARISEFLALPLTTIQWRLHQTRKQLKQQLQTHEKE